MFGKLLMIKLCINGCVLIKQEDFNLIMVLVNEKCVVFICTADLTSSVKQSADVIWQVYLSLYGHEAELNFLLRAPLIVVKYYISISCDHD